MSGVKSVECLSGLAFERFLSGDMAKDEHRALASHVASCTRCDQRCRQLLEQRADFLKRAPSWEIFTAARVRPPAAQTARQTSTIWAGSLGLAAAAALFLAFLPREPSAAVRSKGRPHLSVFVKHKERIHRAESGETVAPGDLLRFEYSTSTASEFALLHRDARSASIYFPEATRSAPVRPGRDVRLDFSLQLDAAPGAEHFYGLFCERPTELEPLRAALEAHGSLQTPAHCQVDSLILHKLVQSP